MPETGAPPGTRDADTQNLNELTTRRNQLITMLVAEKKPSRAGHRISSPQDRGPHQLAGE